MSIEQEIAELNGIIEEHDGKARSLAKFLAPVTAREHYLRDRIKRTHVTGQAGDGELRVVAWRREGIEEREGLFAELDRLADVHGPARERLRQRGADLAAAERALARLVGLPKRKR